MTDKAVSKWERGLGFPDIKTIEPLAEAIDVIDVITYQKKIERRNIFIGIILIITVIMAIFLFDTMHLEGMIFVCIPMILLSIGIWLIVLSRYRYKHNLSYSITMIFGILSLLFPIMLGFFLFFAFMPGGPVPK